MGLGGGRGEARRVDLRTATAALWILAAILVFRALPEKAPAPPAVCADEERRVVDGGRARGRLPLLLCPLELGDRVATKPSGATGLLLGRPVDLNEASLEELQALPGIGPGLGRRILADRAERGPFRSLDELGRVKGFGPVRVEALRGWATATVED